jgi:hypothetical protein
MGILTAIEPAAPWVASGVAIFIAAWNVWAQRKLVHRQIDQALFQQRLHAFTLTMAPLLHHVQSGDPLDLLFKPLSELWVQECRTALLSLKYLYNEAILLLALQLYWANSLEGFSRKVAAEAAAALGIAPGTLEVSGKVDWQASIGALTKEMDKYLSRVK